MKVTKQMVRLAISEAKSLEKMQHLKNWQN